MNTKELSTASAGEAKAKRIVAARKLYNAYTDNHPTIHCNRFPSWEELDAKERKEWIKKAGIAPAGGIGGEKP